MEAAEHGCLPAVHDLLRFGGNDQVDEKDDIGYARAQRICMHAQHTHAHARMHALCLYAQSVSITRRV